MRTKFFTAIAAFAVAFGFAACSSSDDVSDGGQKVVDGEKASYISINVQGLNDAGNFGGAKANAFTRADNYTEGGGTYRDGDTDESVVKNVRFYFFYTDGTGSHPYLLQNCPEANGNYMVYDFNQTTPSGADHDETVENTTQATLILQGAESATSAPDKVVAVVNAPTLADGTLSANMTLDQLRAVASVDNDHLRSDNGFIMTNSVYPGSSISGGNTVTDGTTVFETDCTGKIYSSEALATANPVTIYVERVAAKVSVDQATASTTEPTYTNADGGMAVWFTIDSKPAYIVDRNVVITTGASTTKHVALAAVVQNWGLADEATNANLVKSIADYGNWWYSLSGQESTIKYDDQSPRWFMQTYHRSYWEIIPAYVRNSHSWNEYNTANNSFSGSTYTVPNTPTRSIIPATDNAINRRLSTNIDNDDLTKVVVCATLYYKDLKDDLSGYAEGSEWKVANIVRYGGRTYLADDGQTAGDKLKSVILGLYTGDNQIYSDNAGTVITTNDLKFSDVTSTGQATDYKQSVILTGESTKQYYKKEGDNYVAYKTGGQSLTDYGEYGMIYDAGRTYYYTTIQHLWYNTDNLGQRLGAFGVVRNHLYDIKISSLSGAGTPVPDPDKPIIPVTPEDKLSYMAAQIKVLSWRVVNQTVRIDGTVNTNE